MKKVCLILIVVVNHLAYSQNYIGGGVNAGLGTSGVYIDYLFLKHFELQMGNEFQRYGVDAAFLQLKGHLYKKNTDNKSLYISCAINQSFQHNTLIKYQDIFYSYKIHDNYYIIPGIGFKFTNANTKNSILKYGYTCINVNYRFNIGSKKTFSFRDTIPVNTDVDSGLKKYYNGRLGIYLTIGVSFGKRS